MKLMIGHRRHSTCNSTLTKAGACRDLLRVASLVLVSVAATAEIAPPAELALYTSQAKAKAGDTFVIWIVRRGSLLRAQVVVQSTPGSQVFAPSRTSARCPAPAAVTAATLSGTTLDPPASGDLQTELPAVICVRGRSTGTVTILASAHDPSGALQVAKPVTVEITEPVRFWSTTAFATLLSAFVGFVFGLGSTWIGALLDGWKAKRALRVEGEKFMVSAIYPELVDHAKFIRRWQAATSEQRQKQCTESLPQASMTAGLFLRKAKAVASYLPATDPSRVATALTAHDARVMQYNDLAAQLHEQPQASRDASKVEPLITSLTESLDKFGLF